MQVSNLQHSIVLSASGHNPTLINPDFLRINEIVPEEWAIGGPVITTPAFSQVQYNNGVVIIVEQNKFQITMSGHTPSALPLSKISQRYIQTLPHIPYDAVGINFTYTYPMDDSNEYIKDRFLREGEWNSESSSLYAAGINLVFHLEGVKLTFSINSGIRAQNGASPEGERANQKEMAVISNANFHRDCDQHHKNESALANLERIEEDWERFRQNLQTIVGITDE